MTLERRRSPQKLHRLGVFAFAVLFLFQAVLFSAAPKVAVAADNDTVVICTSSGMKVVSLAELGVVSVDDLDLDDTSHLSSDDHCALCAFGHAALPSVALSFSPVASPGLRLPQADSRANPYGEGRYTRGQPRAPPHLNV